MWREGGREAILAAESDGRRTEEEKKGCGKKEEEGIGDCCSIFARGEREKGNGSTLPSPPALHFRAGFDRPPARLPTRSIPSMKKEGGSGALGK